MPSAKLAFNPDSRRVHQVRLLISNMVLLATDDQPTAARVAMAAAEVADHLSTRARGQIRLQVDVAIPQKLVKLTFQTELPGAALEELTTAMLDIAKGDPIEVFSRELSLSREQPGVPLLWTLEIRLKRHPGDDVRVRFALRRVGDTQAVLRRHEEGRQAQARSLTIFRKAHGDEHDSVADTEASIGDLELAAGRPREALRAYERALVVRRKVSGPGHIMVASDLASIAQSLMELGATERARQPMEEALVIAEANPEGGRLLPTVRFALAKALWSDRSQRRRVPELLLKAREGAPSTPAGEERLAEIDAWAKKRIPGW